MNTFLMPVTNLNNQFFKYSCLSFFFLLTVLCSCKNQQDSTTKQETISNKSSKSIPKDSIEFEEEKIDSTDYLSLEFPMVLQREIRRDKKFLNRKFIEKYSGFVHPELSIDTCYGQQMYGAKDSFWIIEASLPKDSSCYPRTKNNQFIFNKSGKIIHIDSALTFRWIRIKKEKNPVLLTLNTECGGKGYHHVYKFENEQLIDIFNTLLENNPYTFDAEIESDNSYFKPFELDIKVLDKNKDGYFDLVFSGQKITSKNKNIIKSENIEYVYIFQSVEDWYTLKNSKR
jgi:hypothetical protein